MAVRKWLRNYSNENPNQLMWHDCGWILQNKKYGETTSYDIVVTHILTSWVNFSFDFGI